MQDFQQDFIEFSISKNVLKFGKYKLKSGRISPYFFNSGLFNDGESLRLLGEYYAKTIINSGIKFDMLYGPAYKGIPLASSLAIALAQTSNRSVPYCFNRKEGKDHGEGGIILGAPLSNDVLIVDDVITAGTSVKESVKIIKEANARPAGVIIALDRQEKGSSKLSAIQEIEINYKIPVISIISLDLLIEYLSNSVKLSAFLGKIEEYQINYGINCK
ncbi:MAG: orotate phosphoribosyltransferase [Gammaproteobacteria bacterium]|jgi:orotate phosphoribosyltransferase